jgi:hypothetical protein
LQPDDAIPAQNTAKSPLFISVAVVEQLQKEMVSMPYGKAKMPFISEATGVEDENQVWENIPVDMNCSRRIAPSLNLAPKQAFIDENGSLFVSKEYQLIPENYVKEGFDLIYLLVNYVVKQSHVC